MPSLKLLNEQEINQRRLDCFKNEIISTVNNANLRSYNKTNIFIVEGTPFSVDLLENLKKLQKEYFQEYRFELEKDSFADHTTYWVYISKDTENAGVFEIDKKWKPNYKKWIINISIIAVAILVLKYLI